PGRRPGLGKARRGRRFGVPHVEERVEPAGARALVVQAEVDLVELNVHAGDPELLLQEARVLAADGTRRREEQSEGEGAAALVADAVAVRVGPAGSGEQSRRLATVVGQLMDLRVP